MLDVLAKTLLDATRLPKTPVRRDMPRSWYAEDLRCAPETKRWEDWK